MIPTDNAASGENYGLELDANWRINDQFRLEGSLGLGADVASLPGWLEPLFLDVLASVARGLDEDDQGGISARVEGIRESFLFREAIRRDDSLQHVVGLAEPQDRSTQNPQPAGNLQGFIDY